LSERKHQSPIHTISAFPARERFVLGRIELAEKSNELVAISKLLDLLATEGAIVGTKPSAVKATSEATQCALTPALKASAEPYPSSAKWSRCFFALWCTNWSVVPFDSRMHCSVTCHSHG